MRFSDVFYWNARFSYKATMMLVFLLAAPNILGAINFGTVWGFKIHTFQLAMFIAAITFGPVGGMLSGLVGSTYSAVIMQNPYIIIGNAILGMAFGFFHRRGFRPEIAAMLAFLAQLPWLAVTDYYFVGLSAGFILRLCAALIVSDIIWAVIANKISSPIKNFLR